MKSRMVCLVVLSLVAGVGCAQDKQPAASAQDAGALEDQYKTCAKHSIPADKCTSEIYSQLKAKDNVSLDPRVVLALDAVKSLRSAFFNPESLQVRVAYAADESKFGDHSRPSVCLELGGQNQLGGMAVKRYIYYSISNKKHPEKEHMTYYEIEGVGSLVFCSSKGKLLPGQDVTEQVRQALKDGR